jgi:hypothetical protein
LSVAASACGAGEHDAASASVGSTLAPGQTAPPTTVDPALFETTLNQLSQRLEAADGDLCGLVATLDGAVEAGNPTTEEQARAAARFLGAAYDKIAAAAPPEAKAQTAEIRQGAQSMLAEAENPSLDVDRFTQDGPEAFHDEKFLTAMSKLFLVVRQKCGGEPTTTGG